MNPEGLELMLRTIARLEERVAALEAAKPALEPTPEQWAEKRRREEARQLGNARLGGG